MLFSGDIRHRLEPVGIMGSALLRRPVLHSVGHHIGHAGVKAFAVLYGLFQGPVGFLGKPGLHNLVVKHHGTE